VFFLLPRIVPCGDLSSMHQTSIALQKPQFRHETDTQFVQRSENQSVMSGSGSGTQQGCDPAGQGRRELLVRKILVPTNFSPASTQAVQQAVLLADQCNAALTILHVVDINAQTSSGTAEDLMRNLWDQGSVRMGRLAWSISSRIRAQTLLAEGLPWEVIVEKSREFDLVVVGQGSTRTAGKLFSRHTARRVAENSSCPVMLVSTKQTSDLPTNAQQSVEHSD
jgi:nucleotide-binding universal stress UspA family protein